MSSVYSLGATASVGESWANPTSSPRSTLAAGYSGSAAFPAADDTADDTKDTSTIPTLAKVEELEGSNPSQFQHVVTDAVTQLKSVARETSDPIAASYLWNLANRFELALDSGDGLPAPAVPAKAESA